MTPRSHSENPQQITAPIAARARRQVDDYFAPFVRVSGQWHALQITKTIVMTIFVLPLRLLYFVLAAIVLLCISFVAMFGVPPSRAQDKPPKSTNDSENAPNEPDSLFDPLPAWRRLLISFIFPIARSVLFFSFGVFTVETDEAEPPSMATRERVPAQEAHVIVANHLGYIDVLVLLCQFHGSFVSKGDLEYTPIVGTVARALQCMFVRKGQSLTTQLINRVQSTYICHRKRKTCPGCPACMNKLVIFPEGTTANGTAMVPFRTGIFNAGLPVLPVCIRFPWTDFNMSWETIRFGEHMFRTMTQFRNRVQCIALPVYVPTEEEVANSRLYAFNVQNAMREVLEQPIAPLNRKHKFLYHSYLLGKETNTQKVLEKAENMRREDDQLVYFMDHEKTDGNV